MRVAYRVPRQVVLVTSRWNGNDNVWPMDWHMPLSFNPKLYCISLSKGSYGEELIRHSGVFIVHMVPAAWEPIVLQLGALSGRSVDKFSEHKIEVGRASVVDAPRIQGCLGVLECKLVNTVDAGDHTLFIAEVVHEEADVQGLRLHHIDRQAGGIADTLGSR